MSSQAEKSKYYPAITALEIGNDTLIASMSDGREVSIPMAWFARLATATKDQLINFCGQHLRK